MLGADSDSFLANFQELIRKISKHSHTIKHKPAVWDGATPSHQFSYWSLLAGSPDEGFEGDNPWSGAPLSVLGMIIADIWLHNGLANFDVRQISAFMTS